MPENMPQLTRDELFIKLRAIVSKQLGVDEAKITLQSGLTDDLGADSLDVTEVVMGIEEEFKLEISDEEIEKIKTVGDIVTYISEKIP